MCPCSVLQHKVWPLYSLTHILSQMGSCWWLVPLSLMDKLRCCRLTFMVFYVDFGEFIVATTALFFLTLSYAVRSALSGSWSSCCFAVQTQLCSSLQHLLLVNITQLKCEEYPAADDEPLCGANLLQPYFGKQGITVDEPGYVSTTMTTTDWEDCHYVDNAGKGWFVWTERKSSNLF